MEIKNWTYEEYPSFDEEIEGVTRIPTTGDEKGTYIYPMRRKTPCFSS